MSTIFLLLAAFILLIMLLDRLPGVRHLVQPIVKAFTWIFAVFFGSVAAWVFYAAKHLFRAHLIFLRHLSTPRNRIGSIQEPEERK